VPLILGPDGARLAKRHGAVTLADIGDPPEAVRGRLMETVGLADPGEEPSMTALLARFDASKLPKAPTTLA
jgi:glutamyl-tRNA synthetase